MSIATGLVMLLFTWGTPGLKLVRSGYPALGCIQAVMSVFGIAGGPITIAVLRKEPLEWEEVLSTSSAMMTVLHALRVGVFVMAGFSYSQHLELLLAMSGAAVVGTYTGVKAARLIPPYILEKASQILITVIALRNLYVNSLGAS